MTTNDQVAQLRDNRLAFSAPRLHDKAKQRPSFIRLSRKTRANSTSTVHISTSLYCPRLSHIVGCMAKYIHSKLVEVVSTDDHFSIWNEEAHPIDGPASKKSSGSLSEITRFLHHIYRATSMSSEVGVMAIAYIDKLTNGTEVHLTVRTYKRIVLACLVLAYKVWEDDSVWNEDLLGAFPHTTVRDLGLLEYHLLEALQFAVTLKASSYAKYYFDLRALASKEEGLDLTPLTEENAKRLKTRSKRVEKSSLRKNNKLCESHDTFIASPKELSLEQFAFRHHIVT